MGFRLRSWHITRLTNDREKKKLLLEPYPHGTLPPLRLVTLVMHGKPRSPFLVQIPSLARCCLGPKVLPHLSLNHHASLLIPCTRFLKYCLCYFYLLSVRSCT
jgi:hypothetical protein